MCYKSRTILYQYYKSHENLYKYYKSNENPYQVLQVICTMSEHASIIWVNQYHHSTKLYQKPSVVVSIVLYYGDTNICIYTLWE